MNNLKTIESKVMAVLTESIEARNNDMKLYLLVCEKSLNKDGLLKLSFDYVMDNYKKLGLPCFESVRRTRQKIQEKHPELRCSPDVYKERKKQQHIYRDYAIDKEVKSYANE